jgi:hypothetical protein
MEILETIKKIKRIIELIDKYDNVAVEIIEAISFLLPKKTKTLLNIIIKYESKTILFLLDLLTGEEAGEA